MGLAFRTTVQPPAAVRVMGLEICGVAGLAKLIKNIAELLFEPAATMLPLMLTESTLPSVVF
jgi:hypothetical protein